MFILFCAAVGNKAELQKNVTTLSTKLTPILTEDSQHFYRARTMLWSFSDDVTD